MERTSLLVIGAGPYGVAVAGAALARGVDTVVLGRPMGFWTDHMPSGMFLRSGPDWHLDADGTWTFAAFLEERGTSAADVDPVPIELFLDYASWYQERADVVVREGLVRQLVHTGGSFEAELEDGHRIRATSVVAAPGVHPFAQRPAWSAGVPDTAVAHTADLVRFEGLEGARVLIVGGRQSAYEWAALLLEHGVASVDVVHRHDVPRFDRVSWDFVEPHMDATLQVPGWWRSLPATEREALGAELWAAGRLTLEWWLVPRLDDTRLARRPGTSVVGVDEGRRAELGVALSDGERLDVDHIVLATGYRADLSRVGFLEAMLGEIEVDGGAPRLDEAFQASVPGLYFPGFLAARDFGPYFGFTRGCPVAASLIASDLVQRG